MGDFVKSRRASACAYAGAASSASLPSAWAPASLGERRRLLPGRRGLPFDDPFPVRRPSGHELKLSALPDSRKANPLVDNEDNGGKFNLDQPLPTPPPPS